jgi:hypothetical protein
VAVFDSHRDSAFQQFPSISALPTVPRQRLLELLGAKPFSPK